MTTPPPLPQVAQVQGDSVFALAAAPAGVIYVGRLSGSYRSRDGGASWQDALTSLEHGERFPVTSLTVAGSTVFAGATGAVLRSHDAGESWRSFGLASPPPSVVALVVSPEYQEDGLVVAGTAEDGVFVSNDRGESWVPWNFGLIDLRVNSLVFALDYRTSRTIFAGTESGIFRSCNGGRSWREVPFPMQFAPVLSLGIHAAGRLIAGTESHGAFASDDDGATWQPLDGGFSASAVNGIHVDGATIWLLFDDALVVSSDGGATWRRDPLPPGKLAMALLVQSASPGGVLVGCADGEILRLR